MKSDHPNPNYKRNHWTNEEVLKLLEGMEFCYPVTVDGVGEKKSMDKHHTYTDAINDMREIFEEFALPVDSVDGAPMAYDTESGFRVHIGTALPVCQFQ